MLTDTPEALVKQLEKKIFFWKLCMLFFKS